MKRRSLVALMLMLVMAISVMAVGCSPLEVPNVETIEVEFTKDATLSSVELSLGFSWKNGDEKVKFGTHDYEAVYTAGGKSADTMITVNAKPSPTMLAEETTMDYIENQLRSDAYKKGGAMYESTQYDQYVMILARSYRGVKADIKSAYMDRVKDVVLANVIPETNVAVKGEWSDWASIKYTTNTVMTLVALKESTVVEGIDLAAPYYNSEVLIKNASIYDLNTYLNILKNIDIPEKYVTKNGTEHTSDVTVKSVVDKMIEMQITDGGWSFEPTATEIDLDGTTMAIVALADIKDNENLPLVLKTALNRVKAVEIGVNGGFVSWGAENRNSTATALSAIAAMGEDATAVKNAETGKSVLDFMMGCRLENGAYTMEDIATTEEPSADALLTKDAAIALISYNRYLRGEANFYAVSLK